MPVDVVVDVLVEDELLVVSLVVLASVVDEAGAPPVLDPPVPGGSWPTASTKQAPKTSPNDVTPTCAHRQLIGS